MLPSESPHATDFGADPLALPVVRADGPKRPPGEREDRGIRTPEPEEDGLSRRRLLGYGAGVVGVAGAGWFVYDRLTSGGPAGTVREFYSALDSGDRNAANELIHPDSPKGTLSSGIVTVFEQNDLEVKKTTVVSRGDGTAKVRARIAVTNPKGKTNVQKITVELRKANGTWKIWND